MILALVVASPSRSCGIPLIRKLTYCFTVFALGELAVMYPVSGGFYTYSTRFIDPSWGFAMGWNYVSSIETTYMSVNANFRRSFNGSLYYHSN